MSSANGVIPGVLVRSGPNDRHSHMKGQPIVTAVVEQHASEAAFLWNLRRTAVHDPVTLRELARMDARVEANLDGLRVAGPGALAFCDQELASGNPASLFPAAVLAIESRDTTRIARLLQVAEAVPTVQPALVSALGWVHPQTLRGSVKDFLDSSSHYAQQIGIACCAVQRVDPGAWLQTAIASAAHDLQARSFRAAGELGRLDLVPACVHGVSSAAPQVGMWAAWAAVLLGNRGMALDFLRHRCVTAGPAPERIQRLVIAASTVGDARGLLTGLAANPLNARRVIQGIGVAGDPTYVPWLTRQMRDPRTARIAGEALAFMTGVNFSEAGLEASRPPDFDAGPNEDADDPRVDMDADDGLPWPDADRVQAWWSVNFERFQPGTRYFVGEPVTREHCIAVLMNGHQRQRMLAAEYLSLVTPGTPLFNTSAPAWRQQQLLAQMQ